MQLAGCWRQGHECGLPTNWAMNELRHQWTSHWHERRWRRRSPKRQSGVLSIICGASGQARRRLGRERRLAEAAPSPHRSAPSLCWTRGLRARAGGRPVTSAANIDCGARPTRAHSGGGTEKRSHTHRRDPYNPESPRRQLWEQREPRAHWERLATPAFFHRHTRRHQICPKMFALDLIIDF